MGTATNEPENIGAWPHSTFITSVVQELHGFLIALGKDGSRNDHQP